MLSDSKKYNKEIDLVRSAGAGEVLHPLRKAQIKQELLRRIELEGRVPTALLSKLWERSGLVKYIVSTVVGVSLIAGSAFAATSARPGDALFPVKKLTENIQIGLTTNPKAKASLQARIAQDRLKALIEAENSARQGAPGQNFGPSDNSGPKQIQQGPISTEPLIKPEIQPNQPTLQNHAADQAAKEFSEALNKLKSTQQQFEQQGDSETATSLNNTIIDLQQKSNLNADQGDEHDGNQDHGDKKKGQNSNADQNQNQNSGAQSGDGGNSHD